ncbi:MAG: hypothetical protein FJW39_15310 [Acidobacteria bacterium]|nr:hypothetical protein [Acidobacteriota bacterium]
MSFLNSKQTKFGGYVAIYVAVVLAVLGVANFLAQRHNKSWDTTANKRFSLSDQTVKIVSELKNDVKVTHFAQTSAFTDPRVRDLLDRYDNLSTKLSVDYIDPDKKPTVAKAAGVRNYGTTFIEANGKREEARSVTEEEMTGAIIRALKGGARTVCWVSGSGERDLDDSQRSGFSNFKDVAERNNYKTQKISLLEKAEVGSDCTVLLIAGPRRDYLEPQVNAVKKYVEEGGRALILLDPPVQLARDETDENAALANVIKSWGVTLNKDIVLELSSVSRLFGLGPEMPMVASYESHQIVREMKETATAFPLIRTLDVKTEGKATAEKLFSSAATSVKTADLKSAEIKISGNEAKGPFTLGAAVKYTTGKEKLEGRVVVVGSSGWASNTALRFGGNRDLAVNMLNWLSSDEELISIRPKDPEDRRLTMSARQMRWVFFSSVLILPLLIIAAGLRVWWQRR